ncbi:(3R)-3-hydroxyacyl-CoA dehydrogenase [Ptiloglossa arizonensis]|uniref:(3R)-3-hydroxyacyl-CoA dehydrogenase n=1 Tax=Ptiloglossa arizonensis TaxID=3350558 RepID=UPI003F9F0152
MVAGKLAFVTGAGSGIGREVCRILASRGTNVIAADRNLKTAQQTIESLKGSKHLALQLEVSDLSNVTEAFHNAIITYSTPPTIIINSAGITRDEFILKLGEHEFDQVFDVNLKGTFFVMQTAVKNMIDANINNGSSIVNVGSLVGKIGNIGSANYAASKAGVEALSKTASLEFGQFGIRVNTVLPGFIQTPMTDVVPEKVKQMMVKRIPLRRMGTPEEVAQVITFLASSESSYVNGASIDITGGFH